MSEASATGTADAPDAARRLADAATWRRLLSATDQKGFSSAWLNLLAAQVDLAIGPLVGRSAVVGQAMVALGAPDSRKYARTAWLGAEREISLLLAKAGERAIHVRHGVVQVGEGAGSLCQIAHPILAGDAMLGVVALELPLQAKEHLDVAMRLAQWGVVWFAQMFAAAAQPAGEAATDTALRLAVLTAALSARRHEPAAEAAATLLADRLDVDKVSVGRHRHHRTRLLAVSHGGFAPVRNAYLTALTAAMEEAADGDGRARYPLANADLAAPHAAQAALARSHGADWICTVAVPLAAEARERLVLLAEGSGAPPVGLDDRLETLANDLAPLTSLRLRAERGPVQRLRRGIVDFIQARPAWHTAGFAAAALAAAAVLMIPLPYRVSVDATLEPLERRTIAAPFDGYLAEATARPGDRVAAGAVLGRFDDRELLHQRAGAQERLSETSREMNEAVGINDRAKATVLAARKAQIEADLSLVEDQLRRIDLRAPFDAVVVAGDKTQSIGAPMRRGDPLYELSPLGSFRVVLDVPQADFARIVPGQPGRLLLSALPYQTHDLTVARMTPIAVAHDGKTVLRAEADMLQADDLLRPGMQGLADIDVGRARLGWLLTHRIIDWVRIKLWVWLP
jgi:multidrug resistance efflux pump